MANWIAPNNWYWSIQDSSPGTQVWKGSIGAFVAFADADYVAFLAAGNVATSIDTFANFLQNPLDSYNQSNAPSPYLAVSSGVNYQIANTPPLILDFTPTAGSLSVTLPQMNLFGSVAKGRPLIIHNAGAFPFSLKNNSGSSFALFSTVPIGASVHLYLNDNSTSNGSFDVEQVVRTVAVAPGDANATLSITGNPITTVATTSLTAPRTWNVPSANTGIAGSLLLVIDPPGVITATNTVTLSCAASGDSLNGNAGGTLVLNRAFGFALLETNGGTRWTIVGGKGSLASTDLSDLPIPASSGGTGDTGTAYTNYSPTVTAQTPGVTPPTFTVNTASFKTLGKTVWWNADITINTVGTGTLSMLVTLPATAASINQVCAFGAETALSGKFAGAYAGGPGGSSTTIAAVRMADGTFVFALGNGARVVLTGTYESA